MFGLDTKQLIVVAVAVAMVGWIIWDNRGWLAKFVPSFTTTKTKPDRKAILSLLDDAYQYFEAENCPEGKAAIRAAMQHVFHNGHTAPPVPEVRA